jgi:hypothetical protein
MKWMEVRGCWMTGRRKEWRWLDSMGGNSLRSPQTQTRSMTVILSSALATLSYLPFQLVAKVTIGVCALLFVVDPYPGSRLISLICTGVVLLINRAKEISPLEWETRIAGEEKSLPSLEWAWQRSTCLSKIRLRWILLHWEKNNPIHCSKPYSHASLGIYMCRLHIFQGDSLDIPVQ